MALPAEFKAHSALVHGLVLSPDGKQLATAGFDAAVRLWSADSGQEVRTLSGHAGPVYAVAFTADGQSLASCGDDKSVRLWSPADGKMVKELKGHGGVVDAVAFAPDGRRVASASADKSVRMWEVADGQGKPLGNHGGSVYAVAFAADGQRLASAGADGLVKIWDVPGQKEHKALKGHDGPVSVVIYTSDGPLSAGFDRTLRLWDADGGSEKSKAGPLPDDPYGLALSKDGKRVAVAGYGGHVAVWDIAGGKAVFTKRYKSPAYCVIWATEDSTLLSGHDDGHVRTTVLSS
jgi:WD40 repeat protein